jgi:hypothetical protein
LYKTGTLGFTYKSFSKFSPLLEKSQNLFFKIALVKVKKIWHNLVLSKKSDQNHVNGGVTDAM